MNPLGPTPRRGFLARLAGAAAALTAGGSLPGGTLVAQGSTHDRWLTGLKGAHRCLFDFPLHAGGLPLIHMYNYINTYKSAYAAPNTAVNAVGTLYGPPGETASIPLAWNDAMWEKYKIGELLKLTDPATKLASKRNMYFRPKAGDPVLGGGAFAVAGIESLQRMGATFLMCNNAFQMWVSFLSGSGTKGNPSEIERDLRANLVPGVITVPAIVIAIEKAQGAGVAYNRQ
jgi:hypothetical protein